MEIEQRHLAYMVSIHAPARGATFFIFFKCQKDVCFNPRSRAGSDIIVLMLLFGCAGFNPRSRAGSDLNIVPLYIQMEKFQSTLPRGERLYSFTAFLIKSCFNPRSRAGSDFLNPLSHFLPDSFNPRSRAGSDGFMSWVAGEI